MKNFKCVKFSHLFRERTEVQIKSYKSFRFYKNIGAKLTRF